MYINLHNESKIPRNMSAYSWIWRQFKGNWGQISKYFKLPIFLNPNSLCIYPECRKRHASLCFVRARPHLSIHIFLHCTNDVPLYSYCVYFYILSDTENVATNRNRMTVIGYLVEYSDIDMNRRFDIVGGSRSSTSLLPGTTNCLRHGDVTQKQHKRNSHHHKHHNEFQENCQGRRGLTIHQKQQHYEGSKIAILWCRTEDICVLRPNQFLIRSWRERWVNICSGKYSFIMF